MGTSKVLVLIEEHYDETEFHVFNTFFPENGFEVVYASNLWGNEKLEFEGNDKTSRVTVDQCVTQTNLDDYQGMILIGGYAMDRLRYEVTIDGEINRAPAVELLRQAVKRMDEGKMAIGTICHSLWLFCADPQLIKGRTVTCAHNIVCDVKNAGGIIAIENGETVETYQDGLLVTGRHPGCVDAFDQLFLSVIQKLE